MTINTTITSPLDALEDVTIQLPLKKESRTERCMNNISSAIKSVASFINNIAIKIFNTLKCLNPFSTSKPEAKKLSEDSKLSLIDGKGTLNCFQELERQLQNQQKE
jgi:hypothetical protein